MLCRKLFRGRLSVAGGLSKCIRRKYEDRADGELWHRNGCLHAGNALFEKKGMVVTSEELFKAVWADEYYEKNSNTITVHVRHLREKMGDAIDEPRYIKTVWGVGYKIEN